MLPEAVKRNADRAAKLKGHEFDGPGESRSDGALPLIRSEVEGPPMLPPMYNNNMEIVQGPGYVAILNEMYHDIRAIPLGRPAAHARKTSAYGAAIQSAVGRAIR